MQHQPDIHNEARILIYKHHNSKCTSLICSSMAIYSSPFCKNVISAPGGISV